MNASFLKSILNRAGKILGLHPDVGNLLSGSFRLTNPSSAAFPTENLPLASRVIASGMWNYCFFQFYRHFAGPYWVEKQYNPKDPSFIPRAGSMLSVNLTNRDWMGFRSPFGKNHAMVDPSGALCPVIGYYSIEVSVIENGSLRLPSKGELHTEQTLLDDLPIPVTIYGGKTIYLKWTSAGSLNHEYTLSEIEYESDDPDNQILVSIRPFNPEGAALIHSIKIDENNIIHINGIPEIILFSRPAEATLSNLEMGDAYFSENHVNFIECPHGVSTATFRFHAKGKGRITFAARTYEQIINTDREGGILRNLFSFSKKNITQYNIYKKMDLFLTKGRSLKKLRKNKKVFRRFTRNKSEESSGIRETPVSSQNKNDVFKFEISDIENYVEAEINKSRDAWEKIISKGAKFHSGRNLWNRAAKIFTGYIMTLYTQDSITPGVFTYRQFWFRDAAYMISALDRWNFRDETENILIRYPSLQSRDGFFKSHDGEWDSNGQALWTLASHIKLTGNLNLLAHIYPSMKKGADWIIKKRAGGLEKKLMPAGFSAEHLGPGDYYYWDNFWSIAGLFDTSYAAELMGLKEEADFFQNEAMKYVNDIVEISKDQRDSYGIITAGPARPADAGMIGSLCLLYPLQLSKIFPEEQVKKTVSAIYKNYFNKGLFFHPIIHSGYNIYLSLQTAQVLFRLNDVSTARKILKKVLRKRKALWTYPEAIHPLTGGGVMGDGFHGWAFAEVLQLLREFTVSEEADTLRIFKGLTRKELFDGSLEFGPFPVHGGSIFIKGNMDRDGGELNITFEKNSFCPYKIIALQLPVNPRSMILAECSGASYRLENQILQLENFEKHIDIRLKFSELPKAC